MIRVDPGTLRGEFKGRSGRAAYRRFQREQREEQERRERKEQSDNEASDLIEVAVAMASVDAIRSLQADINRYDTATINALHDNEKQLKEVRAELEEMLAQAYVLPDGRRVFKTEDGLRVFDEHGKELSPDLIDPDEIADHLPRWERFKLKLDQHDALETERSELIEYQDKLDAARERLEAGDLTQADYDRLRQDLVNEMPDAVRRQIPELAEMEAEAEPQEASADNELDISDEHVPTKGAPAAVLGS